MIIYLCKLEDMHQQEAVLAMQIYADFDALTGFDLCLNSIFQNASFQILILHLQH